MTMPIPLSDIERFNELTQPTRVFTFTVRFSVPDGTISGKQLEGFMHDMHEAIDTHFPAWFVTFLDPPVTLSWETVIPNERITPK